MIRTVKRDRLTIILGLVAAFLIIISGIQLAYILTRPDPVKLLNLPLQEVVNPHKDGKLPVIPLRKTVNISAIKCNLADAPIDVIGTVNWTSVAPGGNVIKIAEGPAVREPGCTNSTFDNPVPLKVFNVTCSLLKQERYDIITWRINGTETPIDPSILTEAWTTEPFGLIDEIGICPQIKP